MSNIREQLAAKRLEARNSPARRKGALPPAHLDDKTVSGQISRAARNGKLDLTSMELTDIPPEVYMELLGVPKEELSRPPKKLQAAEPLATVPDHVRFDALSLAGKNDELAKARVFGTPPPKPKWSEPEELETFKASFNRIREIEVEIGLFGGLKSLDLHGNEITNLPDSVADLLQLGWLDVSSNKLTAFPSSLLLLPKLETVNFADNDISTIDLSSPVRPTEEGLSYGPGFLISGFERQARVPKKPLMALRSLNLANNNITNAALAGLKGHAGKLRVLNLSNNRLEGILNVVDVGLDENSMPELASLVLSNNRGLKLNGELSRWAAVDTEGCNTFAPSNGGVGRSAPSSPQKAEAPKEEDPKYIPAPGGPTDAPEPTLTITFITHPAATFDSDPLGIEMDVYLPPSADKPCPTIIWWHGGGLLQGNKENLPPHLRRLPQKPFHGENVIVISPNYRLSPQAPILDVLADVDAATAFAREKLNGLLEAKGHAARVDPARIVLSGGSAGGYLALMAGLPCPNLPDAELGGYLGPRGWKPAAIAPFYPITDLEHAFWATETNPVPWWGTSVPDSAAKPHLNLKDAPVQTAKSGGPRSILYPYMLQHALFPRLLFMNQRSRGSGLDGYRPSPHALSVTTRAKQITEAGVKPPPIYLVYGTRDDKIQPLDESVELLERMGGEFALEVIKGADHGFDEEKEEQCEGFYLWLRGVL